MPEAKDTTEVSNGRKRDKLKNSLHKFLHLGPEESLKGSTSAKDLAKDVAKDQPKTPEADAPEEKQRQTEEKEEKPKVQVTDADRALAKRAMLKGDVLQGGIVGRPLRFVVVHPKEARANYLFNVMGPRAPDIQKKFLKDGNIAIDATFSEKGTYFLYISLGWYACPIQGSPFKLLVHQDEEAMSQHQAVVAAAAEAMPRAPSAVLQETADATATVFAPPAGMPQPCAASTARAQEATVVAPR